MGFNLSAFLRSNEFFHFHMRLMFLNFFSARFPDPLFWSFHVVLKMMAPCPLRVPGSVPPHHLCLHLLFPLSVAPVWASLIPPPAVPHLSFLPWKGALVDSCQEFPGLPALAPLLAAPLTRVTTDHWSRVNSSAAFCPASSSAKWGSA